MREKGAAFGPSFATAVSAYLAMDDIDIQAPLPTFVHGAAETFEKRSVGERSSIGLARRPRSSGVGRDLHVVVISLPPLVRKVGSVLIYDMSRGQRPP